MMKKKVTEKNNLGFVNPNIKFAFFGTSHIARMALEELVAAGYIPQLIVTLPAKRGHEKSATDVASFGEAHGIPVADNWSVFESDRWDVAVVVDYGKILPERLLRIPKKGFLNIHPSLLPRLRGPSPMRTAILRDQKTTGVTLILVDSEMDHGPIVAQRKIEIPSWPPRNSELEKILTREGGKLLAQILPEFIAGNVEPHEQNHDIATYSEKFIKEDGLLDLRNDPYQNLLKIRALEGWPGTYAFFERAGKKIRVQILDAHLDPSTSLGTSGTLAIDRVKPEGKREMRYDEFLRSGAEPSMS